MVATGKKDGKRQIECGHYLDAFAGDYAAQGVAIMGHFGPKQNSQTLSWLWVRLLATFLRPLGLQWRLAASGLGYICRLDHGSSLCVSNNDTRFLHSTPD